MREYCYVFAKLGCEFYYVYAESKDDAIKTYNEEHDIKEFPKGMTITRANS